MNAEEVSSNGLQFYNEGKYEEALKCFNKLIESNIVIMEVWNFKGMILIKLKRYKEALECFDEGIKIDNNYKEAWFNKGIVYLNPPYKIEDSLTFFNKAIEIDSNYKEAWFNKAIALNSLNEKEEAIKCYDKAIKIDAKYKEAWNNKGVALIDLLRFNEAIVCCEKAIQLDINYDNAWYCKGFALNELSKFDESIKCYDKAIQINNSISDYWFAKCNALYDLNKKQDALKCIDKSIELNSDSEYLWHKKGLILSDSNKPGEALSCFEKAIQINSNYKDAWQGKSYVLEDLNRNEEALESIDKALLIDENYTVAWNNKGFILNSLARYSEAIKCLNKGLEINISYSNLYNNKGVSLFELDEYEEALRSFDKAIKLDEKYSNAYFWKANTLLELCRFEESKKIIDHGINVDPEFAKLYLIKGKYYLLKLNYDEAFIWFDKAYFLNTKRDKTVDYLYNLLMARTFICLRDFDQALTYLDKAIKLSEYTPINVNYAYLYKSIVLTHMSNCEDSQDAISKYRSEYQEKALYLYAKGLLLYSIKDYDKAIESFNKALIKNPKYTDVLIAKGDCLTNNSKNKEALECYNSVLKIIPNDINALIRKANNHFISERYSEATHYLNQVINIDADCKDAYLIFLQIYKKLDNLIKMKETLNVLIEIDPKDAKIYEQRGDVNMELEDYTSALTDYEKCLSIETYNDDFLSKKLIAENKLREFKEDNNKIDQDIIFDKNCLIDLNDSFISEIEKKDQNLTMNNNNVSFFKNEKELQILLNHFNKTKKASKLINPELIKEEADIKLYKDLITEVTEYDNEITRCMTQDFNISLSNNKSILNKTSVEVQKDLKLMDITLKKLKKYIDYNILCLNKKLEYSLKDYEKIIISKYKFDNTSDCQKVKDYIYGFQLNLSNLYASSQIIESEAFELKEESSIPITLIGFAISLVPIVGSTLKSATDSINKFLGERKVKRNAKSILRIASDNVQFSQIFGKILEEVLEPNNMSKIVKLDEKEMDSNTVSFTDRICDYFSKISQRIKSYIYSDLYNNLYKRMGFIHSNLIVKYILKNDFNLSEFNQEAVILLRKEFDNVKVVDKVEIKSLYSEENTTNNNYKKKSNQIAEVKRKCCLIF